MRAVELFTREGSAGLFETLLRYRGREFTINELARTAGMPFSSAWKILHEWERAGIVNLKRVGRSNVVLLAEGEYVDLLADLLRRGGSPHSLAVKKLEGVIATNQNVKEAYLFGSVAEGRERPGSDIDVAMLVEKGYKAHDLMDYAGRESGMRLMPMIFTSGKQLHEFLAGKEARPLKTTLKRR